MGCFKENEIAQEGELLSAAVIIKDILLRLQNQKFADAHIVPDETHETPEDEAPAERYEIREACV